MPFSRQPKLLLWHANHSSPLNGKTNNYFDDGKAVEDAVWCSFQLDLFLFYCLVGASNKTWSLGERYEDQDLGTNLSFFSSYKGKISWQQLWKKKICALMYSVA